MGRRLYEERGYKFGGSVKVRADGEDEEMNIDSLLKRIESQ